MEHVDVVSDPTLESGNILADSMWGIIVGIMVGLDVGSSSATSHVEDGCKWDEKNNG